MISEPLTVSIDGHLSPVTLPPQEALEAVWQAVQALPIDNLQRGAIQRMFGSGRTDDLERWANGDERTDVPISLPDGSLVTVRVEYGDRMTCRQRVAARHEVRRVERPGGRPDRWIVWDLLVDAPATAHLTSESEAEEWIRRQVQNANYQTGPASRVGRDEHTTKPPPEITGADLRSRA